MSKSGSVITAELKELLRSGARAADTSLSVDKSSVAAIKESGLLAMMVPAEHGGWGWDAAAANSVIEEVANADPSIAIMLYLHCGVVARIDKYGRPPRRGHWLERVARDGWLACAAWAESGSAADRRVISTIARRAPSGDWTVGGEKTFVTSATVADFFLVLAQLRTENPAAQARPASAYGGSGQALFLVPRAAPGVRIPDSSLDMAGMRGSGTGTVDFDDVVVGDADLLCQRDTTVPAMQLPHCLGLTLGAVSAGTARYAYEIALDHLRRKDKLGDPGVRSRLAQLTVAIEAARSVVADLSAQAPYQAPTLPYAAKVFASTTSQDVCDQVRRLLGSAGYMREHEINRVCRDCEAIALMGPPNYLCLSVIGAQLDVPGGPLSVHQERPGDGVPCPAGDSLVNAGSSPGSARRNARVR
ncbi:MAG TPA: acyl-CoA dehydrogenase family protein [Streptosporangiaceae bacterium]|nr:acyl-CoA dehydrogenase family protein [Streptosporangiaceae bacterium]